MKTAIYIEDGLVQLVLTPENDFEKNALGSFAKKPLEVSIKRGQFYACAGGWTRHSDVYQSVHMEQSDNSLILRMTELA